MKTINYKLGNLKSKLKNKSLTIGSWLTIPSIEIVEVLSTADFEWLVIDLEHTSITLSEAKNLINCIQANSMEAVVRVSSNNETEIKKVLDIGANGIIIPMIKTREDIDLASDFIYYPPKGKRGVGLNRAHKYGIDFNKYKKYLDETNVVLIAQIEHIDSVNNLDSILQNKNLDGILVGPYDLSASMGFPGEYDRVDVKKVLNNIEKLTIKSSKSLGFHVIESDHKFVIDKIKSNYNLLAYSIDFLFLGDKVREEMKLLKKNY